MCSARRDQTSEVRTEAIAVMRELGIDITSHRSKSAYEYVNQPFDTRTDAVITVCDNAKESCPVFPARTERLHWPLQGSCGRGRFGNRKARRVP